jgi:AbrB family looped-hinge helix DNA binding protein
MSFHSNMTSKGQVTVPKDIRDALGLRPGEPVEFELDGSGKAFIRKPDEGERIAQKRTELLARIREARAAFKTEDQMPGLANDEWFALVRGPAADA